MIVDGKYFHRYLIASHSFEGGIITAVTCAFLVFPRNWLARHVLEMSVVSLVLFRELSFSRG